MYVRCAIFYTDREHSTEDHNTIPDMNVRRSMGIFMQTGLVEVECKARKDFSDKDFNRITISTYQRYGYAAEAHCYLILVISNAPSK